MRVLACTLILLSALAGDSSSSPCIQGDVHITGTIRDRGGVPLSKAHLRYSVKEWNAGCNHAVGTYLQVETDSTGSYDLIGPAGEGWLTVEDRSPTGPPSEAVWSVRPRRAVLLPEAIHEGEVRADYQFERWRVRLHIVDTEGKPLKLGSADFCEMSGMDLTFGPGFGVRNGEVQMEIGMSGDYAFFIRQYEPDRQLGPWFHKISVHSDTTVTVDLREVAKEEESRR